MEAVTLPMDFCLDFLYKNWKLQQGAKCLHYNWDFMNKIEVRSNTELSQPNYACLEKRGFVGHQTCIKKHAG